GRGDGGRQVPGEGDHDHRVAVRAGFADGGLESAGGGGCGGGHVGALRHLPVEGSGIELDEVGELLRSEADGQRHHPHAELGGPFEGDVGGAVGDDLDGHAGNLWSRKSGGGDQSLFDPGEVERVTSAAIWRSRDVRRQCLAHQTARNAAAPTVNRMPTPETAVERTVYRLSASTIRPSAVVTVM